MSKNIVICMDGTGNRGGKKHGTNVWRIFNFVDRFYKDDQIQAQITYYDDGVGTDDFFLPRLIGGAFGWGLSRKICEAYEFAALNYEEGDRLFLFGFSRGAFFVRCVAGMICHCGLLSSGSLLNADRKKRKRMVKRVLHAYRSEKAIPELGIDDLCLKETSVHFVGVWDTVAAVGGTFGGLTLLDNIARRYFRRRWWGFHDNKPHPRIRHAYQALALDEERATFHPKIWERENNALPLNLAPSNDGVNACVGKRNNENQVIEQGLVCRDALKRGRRVSKGFSVVGCA